MASDNVVIVVDLDSSNFTSGWKNVDKTVNTTKKSVEKNMGSLSKTMASFGKIMAAAFSVKAIVDFSKAALSAAAVQVEAEVKLETVMRQRMKATEESIQQVKDYASSLQSIGVIGDEVTMSGAQQLATFLNSTSALETLMPAMDNLLAQQKGLNASTSDAVSIGNMMGKVMQGQTSSLKRVGITFSEAQEEILKYGNEEERAAMLAQIITENVGNMNEALRSTPQGAMKALSNDFGDLMETAGQFLAVVLQPVINALDVAVLKVQELIKAFAELLGIDISFGTATNGAASGMQDTADAAEDTADAVKAANKATTNFDQLHKVNSSTSTPSQSGSSTSSSISATDITSKANKTKSEFQKIIDSIFGEIQNLFNEFSNGFNEVFNIKDLEAIQKNISSIGDSVKDIFTDKNVQEAAQGFAKSFAYNLGRVTGSFASVGVTIGTFVSGGLSKYLDKNKGFLADKLASLLGTSSDMADQYGDYTESVADFLEIFRSEDAQQLASNVTELITNPLLTALDLLTKFSDDMLELVTQPFIDNVDKFKTAGDDLISLFERITGSLATFSTDAGTQLTELYDEHISPFIDSVTEGISSLTSTFLDGWTTYIQPVLDELGTKFTDLVDNHIAPAFEKVVNAVGKVFDALRPLWENVIVPLFTYLIDTIMPILAPIIEKIGEISLGIIGDIFDVIGDLSTVLSGIIDFIVGVFTGDWEKAWNGIKDIFKGIMDSFVDIVKTPINLIIDIINKLTSKINDALSFSVPDWAGGGSWSVNIPTIPKLAKGGVLYKDTLVEAGEYSNARTNPEVFAPQSVITESLTTALKNAGIGSGNNTGEIHIHNYLFEGQEQLNEYIINANELNNYRFG